MAYKQLFNIVWPQQTLRKQINNPITSQDTTEVSAKVIVEKLTPSSLTYART
jgi:hypothetical protein